MCVCVCVRVCACVRVCVCACVLISNITALAMYLICAMSSKCK